MQNNIIKYIYWWGYFRNKIQQCSVYKPAEGPQPQPVLVPGFLLYKIQDHPWEKQEN